MFLDFFSLRRIIGCVEDLRLFKQKPHKVEAANKDIRLGVEIDRTNNITGFCSLTFPGILSQKRSMELQYSTNQDSKLLLRSIGDVSTIEWSLFRRFLSIPRKSFKTFGVSWTVIKKRCSEIEASAESLEGLNVFRMKYTQRLPDSYFCLQAGATSDFRLFSKIELFVSETANIYKKLYNKLTWRMGVVNGHTHATDKFFLGSNIEGYKPMSIYTLSDRGPEGGSSFLEICSRIGYKFQNIDLFVFSSLGLCSRQSCIFETISSCLLSLLLDSSVRNFGYSIGAGISTPVAIKKVGEKSIQASFAIPLTENPETQKFRVGMSAEF